MNFPGDCELKLSEVAVMQALEGAINGARLEGEDYVRVTSVQRSYSYGPWTISITTDKLAADFPSLKEVAA